MKSVISDRGQITIPKSLRDRLDEAFGSLKINKTTDEIMSELRDSPETV